jgi:hypothetical protein
MMSVWTIELERKATRWLESLAPDGVGMARNAAVYSRRTHGRR